MGSVGADELAGFAMTPTWERLAPVEAYFRGMREYVLARVAGLAFDAAGMSRANALCAEFRASWPHRVPSRWELIVADRAGCLGAKVAEFNAAFCVAVSDV